MNTVSVLVNVTGMAGIFLLIWCWRTLQNPPEASSGSEVRRLTEEEEKIKTYCVVASLFKSFAANSKQEETFKLYKEAADADEWVRQSSVSFRNLEINRYYNCCIKGKPFFTLGNLDAVKSLLLILDQSGDVPSVVQQHADEIGATLPSSSYDLLCRVPLYRHALNTAQEIAGRMEKGSPLVPKAVIAALAHDLGKLPEYYGQCYKSDEHGLIGAMAIEKIPAVRALPYYEAVREAVRGHHITQNSDEFVALVREADQAARRKEFAEAVGAVNVGGER